MVNRKKWLVLSFPANFLFSSFLYENTGNYNNYNKDYFENFDEREDIERENAYKEKEIF